MIFSWNTDKAIAEIKGSNLYPNINGIVEFTSVKDGTFVEAFIRDLPNYVPSDGESPPIGPFGFHIHEKGSCTPDNNSNAFTDAEGHYNPDNQPHGNHAGDFPVLFSNNGIAHMSFFTNKFKIKDIINRSVMIHENPDDYRTQPTGNSGKRIACGVIRWM